MKRSLAAAAVLTACASLPPPSDAPATLAAAESAFAAQSVREDMRVAFMHHFAPDGVFVREGWRNARESVESRPAPPIVLDWRPVHVETAASGEIGLSTGPWRITPRGAAAPEAFGQFVSVWSREPGQAWRVAVDLGISHPEPALWDAPLDAHVAASGAASGGMEEAEADFARESAAHGADRAYARYAAADLRLYREGHAPWLGLDRARRDAAMEPVKLAWSVERSAVARSSDLGYARGHLAAAAAPAQVVGYYLRVWRREAEGWRIALDVVTPAAKG